MTTTRHPDPTQPLYDAAKAIRELAAKVPQGNWEPDLRVEVACDTCGRVISRKSLRAHERRCRVREAMGWDQ